MSQSKKSQVNHTPGPWWIAETDPAHTYIRGTKKDCAYETIAKVWLQGNDFNLANARLISTAPELLEMLETLITCPGFEFDKNMKKAQEIIKKASGT